MARVFSPDEQQRVRQSLSYASRWGGFWYRVVPYRRRVVEENIQRIFGEFLSANEQRQLTKAYYHHLASLVWELFAVQYLTNWRKRLNPVARDAHHFGDAVRLGKGVLLLTAHTGNWEWGLINTAQHIARESQCETHFLSRVLRVNWFRNWRIRRYARNGITAIENTTGSLRQVLRALRAGQAVIMTIDQHAGAAGASATPAPFFGEMTPTFTTLANIALRTGAPVVPLAVYKDYETKQHGMRFYPALDMEGAAGPDANEASDATLSKLAGACNAAFETMIIEHPEQWLWSHRRWRESDCVAVDSAKTK
ncbi:MAG: lysophospholipid acyltransferase family protein [Pseudomonadota bacterium]